MKMDPCDTVKLGAGLVTRRDTEMYSVTRCAGGRGEIGREEKWWWWWWGGGMRERPLRLREN